METVSVYLKNVELFKKPNKGDVSQNYINIIDLTFKFLTFVAMNDSPKTDQIQANEDYGNSFETHFELEINRIRAGTENDPGVNSGEKK